MNNYGQLKAIDVFELKSTTEGLHELTLSRTSDSIGSKDLHTIVLGNFRLEDIPTYPELLTYDRFCFAVRPTTSTYNLSWEAPSLIGRSSCKYGFLLTKNNAFIQPEGWGIERAILSRSPDDANEITVDLISYERILPVWQGTFKLEEPYFL